MKDAANRRMKVVLGQLACTGLEARLGPDLEAGLRTALLYYADSLESGREPLAFPSFCRERPPQASSQGLELRIEDDSLGETLAHEMRRQGVSLEQLVAHAVLLCLADFDRAETADAQGA
jgi:hypothetical protein